VPTDGGQDDQATGGRPAESDAVQSTTPAAGSEPQSKLKSLIAFFDSTTKVLVAVGGLVAATIALVTLFLHLFPPPPQTATVPYVTGATLSSAAAELKAHDFHNIPYLYNCYGSPDFDDVVQQVPGAGALIAVTDPVHLYLQAQNCSTVPSVIGMDLSNAADALHGAGFSNIPWVNGCYGSSEIGAVVTQSPAAGTSYGKNQAVSLKLQKKNC
jgi:beta-lactam-binding protein with PASTA domain